MTVYRDPHKYGQTDYPYSDEYYTPAWCVDALIQHWNPLGWIEDPCYGQGHIIKRLRELGYPCIVEDQGDVFQRTGRPETTLITNPPYSISEKVVRHILEWNLPTAVLLRHEWDCAKRRKDICRRLYMKITLTKRPRWIPDSTGSPRHNFAWYVWDKKVDFPILKYE